MALFDFLFGSTSRSPQKKMFRTREEIRRALYGISSLTNKERKKIMELVVKELDHGGVTSYEWKEKLQPLFYDLRQQGVISSTDYTQLKSLLEQ